MVQNGFDLTNLVDSSCQDVSTQSNSRNEEAGRRSPEVYVCRECS
jgi:hypothetical protein